jgi:hypothetical protein
LKPIDIGKNRITRITPVTMENGNTEYQLEVTRKPTPFSNATSLPTRVWEFLDRKTIAAFILGMVAALVLMNI